MRAAGGNSYDYYGSAVGIYHKNKAAVGAWGSDIAAGGGGVVYTYRMDKNGMWSQNSRLVSPSPTDFEWYGGSISLYHHTLAVGASGSNTGGSMGGAVYVYSDASTEGSWQLKKKYYGEGSDSFGKAVAVHEDILVVGSPGAYRYKADYYDQFAHRTGRVTVYRMKNNEWAFEETITCGDCDTGAAFGGSVAVNSNPGTIVIGQKKKAFVYQYQEGSMAGQKWKDETGLVAPAEFVQQDNSYGISVAVSETTAFVGSRDEVGLGGTQAGVVFAFVGAIDSYKYALQELLRKEIIIYEILYSIIGLGLVILIVLPIVMVGQFLADKMKEAENESVSAKDQKPLIK